MALHGSWLGITLTSLLQPGTSHLPKHRKDRVCSMLQLKGRTSYVGNTFSYFVTMTMFTFLWGLMGVWPVPIIWCLTKKQHKMQQTTGLLSALWRSWARGARCFCCPKWALAPSYTDWFWAGYPSSRQRKVDLVGELCPGWGGFCKAACFHRGADHPTLPPVPKDMCRSDLDAKQGRWSPWRIPFQAAPWTFDSKFCFLSELVVTLPKSTHHVNQGRTCRMQMRMKTWPKRCQEETITN